MCEGSSKLPTQHSAVACDRRGGVVKNQKPASGDQLVSFIRLLAGGKLPCPRLSWMLREAVQLSHAIDLQ